MEIIIISSEVVPFAKTGGLADVAGTLPVMLNKAGVEASVIMPFYKCVKDAGFKPQPAGDGLLTLRHKGTDFYFIENDRLYDRDGLYGTDKGDHADNAERFGFFSKAALAAAEKTGRPDIIHCNDWQTALIPFYLKQFHKDNPLFGGTKTLFTIHNLAYQGVFPKEVMPSLDISEEFFSPRQLEFYGKLSFMKAGIIYSDAINTVSPTYSREILTAEYGCGLEGLLQTRQKDLYGILNAADYSDWNPRTDKFLAANYDKDDLQGKLKCKKDVLTEFRLKFNRDKPLAAVVTRLAHQKGADIIADAMADIVRLGINFILLGTGEEKYHKIFKDLAKKFKGDIGVRIAFDNALAHKMEAGADMFLMPSRYEPCGLNQMYSLKYGTVPVVTSTGGLQDTIEDFNTGTKKGNGFKFQSADAGGLMKALNRAVEAFRDKKLWLALQGNCFKADFSQKRQAEEYKKLYAVIASRTERGETHNFSETLP